MTYHMTRRLGDVDLGKICRQPIPPKLTRVGSQLLFTVDREAWLQVGGGPAGITNRISRTT
jgi:hypothetical protein